MHKGMEVLFWGYYYISPLKEMRDPILVHIKMEGGGNEVGKFLLLFTFAQHHLRSGDVEFQIAVCYSISGVFTGGYLHFDHGSCSFLAVFCGR